MLRLNIGFSKKIGESNYGSRGASVQLDLEAEAGLIDQPERLKDRSRQRFTLGKASVDEELNGTAPTDTNGHAIHNGNSLRRNTMRKTTPFSTRAERAGISCL